MTQKIDELLLRSQQTYPGYLGIEFSSVHPSEVCAFMPVSQHHLAPNGFLHAGSVVSLADTACGIGCLLNIDDPAASFTTIELKSNHLGTARDGVVECVATPVHIGRTTQVWDAIVRVQGKEKPIAMFRCTQLVLAPR